MTGGNMQISRVRRLIAATGTTIAVLLAAVGCASGSQTAPIATSTGGSPTASPTPAPTAAPPPPPLTSTASVTKRRPVTGTRVGVQVSTAPGARITVVAHFEVGDRKKTAHTDSTGSHTFWFPVGTAPAGIRVRVDVRVAAHGQKRSTRVWFVPRQPPPPPAPTAAPAPPSPPGGCHPIASTGNCYEPGEFCPHADAGMTGVAGDGQAIICEDNNGLRWEPA